MTAAPPGLVCKIGGSLLDAGRAPPLVDALRRTAPGLGILALAGGGRAADRVRRRHGAGALDASAAHWAALRTLDRNALRLAGGCGALLPVVTGGRVVGGRAGAAPRGTGADGEGEAAASGLAVLAPSPLLRSEDPLPHGWHVTSDSVAAWVAGRLEAPRLLLLKARGDRPPAGPDHGAAGLPASRAARDGLVDGHLPSLLEVVASEAWVVNGRHPDRLLSFLAGDASAGLRLLP